MDHIAAPGGQAWFVSSPGWQEQAWPEAVLCGAAIVFSPTQAHGILPNGPLQRRPLCEGVGQQEIARGCAIEANEFLYRLFKYDNSYRGLSLHM